MQTICPGGGRTPRGLGPSSPTPTVGCFMLISVGSMPIPDQILTFGFGPPIRVGCGLPTESTPTFSKTPPLTGYTL